MIDPLTRAAPSAARFTADGHVRIEGGLDPAACAALGHRWSELHAAGAGTRRALRLPWCRALADRLRAHASVAALIPHDFVAVQCTAFAKRGDDASADASWLVPLHQDLTIPVQHRVPDAGLTGWSQKEGTWFVQPPVEFLARLVAVRLHVDACGPDDGPLRVVPGSHVHGRLDPAAAQELRARLGEVVCTAAAGDLLALRPLLLHASSPARRGPRRVLHFLFAPPVPPCGLEWPSEA